MATGDVTYSHYGGNTADSSFASGKVESDISEIIKVYCGFQPSRIELMLVDADGTADARFVWQKGMTENHNWQEVEGTVTMQTTKGPYPISDTTGEGFDIPAAMVGAADDDVVYWAAWK